MKTLVAGWFSFEDGHATAGDLLARDLACEWLERAGYPYDVALAPPFPDGLDWRSVDPKRYTHVLFVCGPFKSGKLEAKFLNHFASCRLIGLNLSMLVSLDVWNPFDLLIERDSSKDAHPDITFLSNQAQVPVVGICMVEPQEGALVHVANAAIDRLVASREMSTVKIDTRLDTNNTGLRSPAEVESLITHMDVVVTTRLHGTVLALKNGVPAIAIDPVAGGGKIRSQAGAIDWPVVFNVDTLTDGVLQGAFDYCLTEEGRAKARECRDRAIGMVQEVRDEFISALTDSSKLDSVYLARISGPTKYDHHSKSSSTGLIFFDDDTGASGRKVWRKNIIDTGKARLKVMAWWTLPAPIYRWLREKWLGN